MAIRFSFEGVGMTTEIKPGFERRLEDIQWRSSSKVEKFSGDQVDWFVKKFGIANPSGDQLLKAFPPDEVVVDEESNILTTAGLGRITSLIIAGGGQGLTNTATRLGVGDDNTAASVGQTDLVAGAGATHRYFMTMDATYPSASGGVITAKATYGASDGNFTAGWQEWGLDIGTPTVAAGTTVNAVLLNRKVASLGTKVSPAVWAHTVTLTLA